MSSVPTFAELMDSITEYLAPSMTRWWPNLPVERAEGIYLYTPDGRRYTDFTAGLAVANVGYGHPRVVQAAQEQTARMIHSALGLTHAESPLRLARKLIEVLPAGMDTLFFGNSGAEAMEAALKMARFVTKRPGFITCWGGFHGRLMATSAITSSKAVYRARYEPMLPGVHFTNFAYCYRCPVRLKPETCDIACLDSLTTVFERALPPSEVAAIILEPIQGESGYIVPPVEFLRRLRRICDTHGILLIFDEIQTGFGRTGRMFAAQTFDVQPDIMAIAKSIGSGFPLGAVVSRGALMQKWAAGAHSTTFGGNPVACSAGLATLEVIRDENLLANSRQMGDRLKRGVKRLQSRYPIIGDVRGVGLMVGMELIMPGKDKKPNPRAVTRVLESAFERGLITCSAGLHSHCIRLFPPLIVNAAQIDEALGILDESLAVAMQD